MTPAVPLYQHDCTHCVYLGRDASGTIDHYVCKGDDMTSVIARLSSEGSEYHSWSFYNHGLSDTDQECFTGPQPALAGRPLLGVVQAALAAGHLTLHPKKAYL